MWRSGAESWAPGSSPCSVPPVAASPRWSRPVSCRHRHGSIAGAERWRVATMRPGPPLGGSPAELTVLGHRARHHQPARQPQPRRRALALASAAVLADDDNRRRSAVGRRSARELFTPRPRRLRGRFIVNLVDAAANRVALRVVVTMRADFWTPRWRAFPELAQLMVAHRAPGEPVDLEGGGERPSRKPAWRSGLASSRAWWKAILDDAVGKNPAACRWSRRRWWRSGSGTGSRQRPDVGGGYVAAGMCGRRRRWQAGRTRSSSLGAESEQVVVGEGGPAPAGPARRGNGGHPPSPGTAVGRVHRRPTVPLDVRALRRGLAAHDIEGASGVVTVDVPRGTNTGWPRLQTSLDEDREDLRIPAAADGDQATAWIEQGPGEAACSTAARSSPGRRAGQAASRLHLSGSESPSPDRSRDERRNGWPWRLPR